MAWQGKGMGAAWARHAMCESAFIGPHFTLVQNTRQTVMITL